MWIQAWLLKSLCLQFFKTLTSSDPYKLWHTKKHKDSSFQLGTFTYSTKYEVETSCISWAIEFTSQESLTHENHCHCILICHQQGIRIEETYYTFAPDLAALVTRRLLSSRFLSLSDLQANWQTAIRLLNLSDSAIFYSSLGEIWPVSKWKRMKLSEE